MSKVLKVVAIVALAVAVVVFAPAIGAALATVAGSLGITVAGSAIASYLVGMAITTALTASLTLFRKQPSMSGSMADRLSTSVNPTAPRKIVFGLTAAGNDVRFFETYGKKKDRYAQVIALASHRVNAIRGFWVENDQVWNGSNLVSHQDGVENVRGVAEGRQGNGFNFGSGTYWRSTASFTGCAYIGITWKLDDKAWPSGIPSSSRTIVEGCPLYDPRLDSTRGGSGAHRIDDQNTWGWRNGSVEIGRNPALALLTYLIGWKIKGKLVWGMGIPAANIDFDSFKVYANICEEQVATKTGGTVQRYTCDGIFSTADAHDTVINGITAAMGSTKMVDVGGAYTLIGGYDDTAGPKVGLTLDDIVGAAGSSTPFVWLPAPASRERFNIVRGRFADPNNLYQLSDWGDPIEQPPLADEIPRTMNLDLGCVSRAETCQRIAKQFLLREYLTPGKFSATFGPNAFAAQVGSIVTLTIPQLGWNAKLFRVEEQAETHDMFYQMTLREESAAIYAWDREEKPLPANIRPTGYDPNDTLAPEGFAITSQSYPGANGYNVSEVHVAWTPEDSGRVSGIQIYSRPIGVDAWTEQAALHDAMSGSFIFTSNAPGIDIEVRSRFRMSNAIYGPWVTATVNTVPVIIDYGDLNGTPGNLGDINPIEGDKLGGIENGATVGGTIGGNIRNPDGSMYVPPSAATLLDTVPPAIPTGLVLTSKLTDAGATMDFNWNAVGDGDLAGYIIAIKQGDGSFVEFNTGSNSFTRDALPRGTSFTAKVAAYDKSGNPSGFSAQVIATTAKDDVPPAPFTIGKVEATYETAFVTVTAPADADVDRLRLDVYIGENRVAQQTVKVSPNQTTTVTVPKLLKATTYAVGGFAFDTSDNASTGTPSVSFTTAGGINVADFTPGLSPIPTVQTLPDPTGYTGAPVVFLQPEGKMYRYVGGAWTKEVAGTDIASGAIDSTKLVDGSVIGSKIASAVIDASKLNVSIGGGNLVRNSSFENTVYQTGLGTMGAGYSIYNNTPNDDYSCEVQLAGRNGGWAQLVKWSGAQSSTKGIYLQNVGGVENSGVMKPNRAYILSYWAKGAGGAAAAGIGLRWNIAPTVTAINYPTINGEWQRWVWKIQTGTTVDPSVFITTDSTQPNGYFYIDEIQIEEGDVLTAYKPALLSGEVTEALVSNAAISNAKLADNAVTATKILAGEIKAGHIAANSIATNKLVAASRPVSVSGLNIRVENGNVVWDTGYITYTDDNNGPVTQVIYGGSVGAVAPPNIISPLYLQYEIGSGKTYLDYTADKSYLALNNWKQVATWSGGSDLAVHAGVSTLIDGGRIVTESITAGQIKASSISTNKLMIADSLNYCENPDFAMGQVGNEYGNSVVESDAGRAYRGTYFCRALGDGVVRNRALMKVNAGDQLYGYAYINQTGYNTGGNSYVRFSGVNAAGGEVWANVGQRVNGGTSNYGAGWYQKVEVTDVVPANAGIVAVRVEVVHYPGNGEVFIGMMGLMRRNGGELIVDGAITAGKIATGAVTADKIQANSITAGKLAIQSRPLSTSACNLRLDTDRVVRWNAGTITFPDINGNYITRTVTAGGVAWNGAWNKPINLCFDSNTDNTGFGSIYYSEDLPYYPQMIPVALWNYEELIIRSGVSTQITGDRIITGSINATKIQGKTIGADQIAAGALTADLIAAGTITAAQIATGALTARVLAIGNSDNIVPDSEFNDPYWWNSNAPDGRLTVGDVGFTYFRRALMLTPGGGIDVFSNFFTVEPGATYKITMAADGNVNDFQPLIHMPGVQWYSMIDGGGVDPGNPRVRLTGSFSQTWNTTYTVPEGDANFNRWQFRLMGSWNGTVKFAVKIVRVSDSTLIKDGAITTNKITVNSLNGDRIQAGTLNADKLDANSVMAGTIRVGTSSLNDIAAQAQNGTPLTFTQYQGVYTINGNRCTKTGGGDQWDYNAWVDTPMRGAFILSGKFTDVSTFIGVRPSKDLATYPGFNYSWHRSADGNWYIFEGGTAIWSGTSFASRPFTADTVCRIEYAGNVINYWADDVIIRSVGATPNTTWWAGFAIARPGSSLRFLTWSGGNDNSLVNTDPAARINSYYTAIDPGKILVSGSTYLSDWRQGGDETRIAGGSISANTVSANKLTVGNRGIGYIGITFEWNPTNNWVYWSDGYVYYTNDAGTLTSDYVAAGNTGGAGAHQWFYWSPGQGVRFSQENPGRENVIMLAAWWGGSNLNVTYGGTIINGDRITTNTIHANRIIAGTITATQIAAGTIGADKLSVGSLSAISANIGTLISYNGAGGRIERDGNGDRGYYNNGVLGYEAGFLS